MVSPRSSRSAVESCDGFPFLPRDPWISPFSSMRRVSSFLRQFFQLFTESVVSFSGWLIPSPAHRLARLRHKDKWLAFADHLKAGSTLEESAQALGVHRNTAFRWRHRFLDMPKDARAFERSLESSKPTKCIFLSPKKEPRA